MYFDMSKRRQQPDVHTFTALLSVCAHDDKRGMERVPRVWQEMKASGVEPDLVTYNTLLQCLKEAGIPDDLIHHGDLEVTIPAISTQELNSVSSVPDRKGGRHRSCLRSRTFGVTSKAQVKLHLLGFTSVSLTLHLTSGWRWMEHDSVEQFLCLLKDSGLVADIRTLNYLSQMASDWTAVVRDVGVVSSERGVASRPAIPDKWCLLSAARLQAQLGNLEGSEVKKFFFLCIAPCWDCTQVIRVFGEQAGFPLGSAGYQAVAVGCLSLQQGLSLLTQMKVSIKQIG